MFLFCREPQGEIAMDSVHAARWAKIAQQAENPPAIPAVPPGFPAYPTAEKYRLTKLGVELGRWLFYDTALSSDDKIACASCHQPQLSFSDNAALSVGVRGQKSERHSMPLVNLAWEQKFFWDGRANDLEAAVLMPVENAREMDMNREQMTVKLKKYDFYRKFFKRIYGTAEFESKHVANALAQFLRSLVSRRSGIDRIRSVQLGGTPLSDLPADLRGLATGKLSGEVNTIQHACAACHESARFGAARFENIGLKTTVGETQSKKFKVPSLYNISYTGPYMHDGSIKTLDEVLLHYDRGMVFNTALSPELVTNGTAKKFHFSAPQLAAARQFLLLFDDADFIKNKMHYNPREANAVFGD